MQIARNVDVGTAMAAGTTVEKINRLIIQKEQNGWLRVGEFFHFLSAA